MKRVSVCATAVAAALLVTPAAALADEHSPQPTTIFGGSVAGGSTSGSFTWYSRSVGVNGDVRALGGSTTVTFEFRQGGTLVDVQTRTASNATAPFSWTEQGASGAAARIDVYLSHDGGANQLVASVPGRIGVG